MGRNGWLFLQNDANDIVGQHTGRVRLNRGQLQAWKRVLQERRNLMERLGTTWVCQIVPDKESVYPEHLPPEIVPSPTRPVHQLQELAEEARIPMTYPLAELQAGKTRGLLYEVTGSHWNQRGAYVAYRALSREIANRGVLLEVVEERDIEWVQGRTGDLGAKLDPPVAGRTTWATLRRHSSRLVFDNGIPNHGRVLVFERVGARGPKCVAFGESFVL